MASEEIVYFSAGLVIIYNQGTHRQNFFRGHTDEVSCLAVHPNGKFVASSQVGRYPPIYIWDSTKRLEESKSMSDDSHLSTLQGHDARTVSLDFSHDGKLLVSVGSDGK